MNEHSCLYRGNVAGHEWFLGLVSVEKFQRICTIVAWFYYLSNVQER